MGDVLTDVISINCHFFGCTLCACLVFVNPCKTTEFQGLEILRQKNAYICEEENCRTTKQPKSTMEMIWYRGGGTFDLG